MLSYGMLWDVKKNASMHRKNNKSMHEVYISNLFNKTHHPLKKQLDNRMHKSNRI